MIITISKKRQPFGGFLMLAQSANRNMSPSSMPTQTNLNGIDLIKFLCAILVFLIHFPPFVDDAAGFSRSANYILQQGVCRLAVPFYFVCSGFFLFRKMPLYELNVDIIREYCYKLFRLFGLWSLLLFLGSTIHLWYLGATAIAIILLSVCLSFRLNFKLIWLLAFLLYIVGLSGDSYHGFFAPLTEIPVIAIVHNAYGRLFGSTRNGVFMGFIFVLMGASFSQRPVCMKPQKAAIGFIISLVCLVAESLLLEHFHIAFEYNMFVFLIPAVYFLFCFAYTVPLKNRSIYKQLRSIGMFFYFIHLAVLRVAYLFLNAIGNPINLGSINPLFVISFPVTMLIAIMLHWLSGKEKCKWINWLLA